MGQKVLNRNIVSKGKTFLGRPVRMWLEGVIFGMLGVALVRLVPFVGSVKILLSIIAFLTLLVLNVIGIKNRSWTQCVLSAIKYSRNRRRLHLRSPEYVRKIKYEEDIDNASPAEQLARKIQQRFDGFIEENRTK
jgi:hypothetical protein